VTSLRSLLWKPNAENTALADPEINATEEPEEIDETHTDRNNIMGNLDTEFIQHEKEESNREGRDQYFVTIPKLRLLEKLSNGRVRD
jgi:hypothetical protein